MQQRLSNRSPSHCFRGPSRQVCHTASLCGRTTWSVSLRAPDLASYDGFSRCCWYSAICTYGWHLTYLVQSSLGREDRDLVVIVRVPRHGAGAIKGLGALRCLLTTLLLLLLLLLPKFVAEIHSRFPVQSLPYLFAIHSTRWTSLHFDALVDWRLRSPRSCACFLRRWRALAAFS